LNFRYITSSLWSKAGHFNKAFSKGPKTTPWIWNFHSDAHVFESQASLARKVFSSNLAHLSLVFFWMSGMHFHGAYFSNYSSWLKDPVLINCSAHLVWSLIGNGILASDIGNYFQGIYITSGIFQLWRSEGITHQWSLKYVVTACLIGTILSTFGSSFQMHISWLSWLLYKKFKLISIHHFSVFFGLSSISWCGHQIHISLPANTLLDSGIDPFYATHAIVAQDFRTDIIHSNVSFTQLLNSETTSVFLGHIIAHHFYIGLWFICSGAVAIHFLNRRFAEIDF
jgi:photosystem I P700 chlorophyll a apoprotein A1